MGFALSVGRSIRTDGIYRHVTPAGTSCSYSEHIYAADVFFSALISVDAYVGVLGGGGDVSYLHLCSAFVSVFAPLRFKIRMISDTYFESEFLAAVTMKVPSGM